ncbi:MAG: chromosomal replication initiator protein DnaA [Coriobacteriia bacterium]|nr:chromosomal replication initiator protein DnaA [Coriobacteriia bacterium]
MTLVDTTTLWSQALEVVRSELNTPTFKTWFEHTAPLRLAEDVFVVGVANEFARDWLESRYSGLLAAALTQAAGRPLKVAFEVSEVSANLADRAAVEARHEPDRMPDPSARRRDDGDGGFNPKYTFDSFVVGSSNEFAYHAALAVAETPGGAYNPLYIYGGVGLGKTHLLQAIGHYVAASFPHKRVKYVSSEQFTNDFINSIGDRDKSRIDGFRRQYRTNDVLLVDDIQFIAGKEQTQEEFFHTFNALQQAGKQIVLSSDKPPKDIGNIEDRLRSRFEMGLITDIQPPELETRIAILRRKVEAERLQVPDEVLSFVAERIASNIRELEGALIRIVAFSSLTRTSIDLDLASAVLKDIFPERTARPISIATIQQEVCKFYGISKSDLVGSKRSQTYVYPRQIAMYLARELTDFSLPRIGQEFGGRDHTTVIHATAKIRKLMNEQREVYNQVQTLTNLIKQRS